MTFVLDASAVLRWIDQEAGAIRVEQIVQDQFAAGAPVVISAPHDGEVHGVIFKRYGLRDLQETGGRFRDHRIDIAPATGELAVRSALIKAETRLPYVDAFGVALTEASDDAILIDADFDFKAAQHLISIEFLPPKSPATPRSAATSRHGTPN